MVGRDHLGKALRPAFVRAAPVCESGRAAISIGMTWALLILVVVMVIAGSKLLRQWLTVLAAMSSIAALVYLLTARSDWPRDPKPSDHASLTSK